MKNSSCNNFQPILPGRGDTDYARYMRTDDLLSLQKSPDEMCHPDELLFQVVHQSTEIWLKLASFELEKATASLHEGQIEKAIEAIRRASHCLSLTTDQLEMLTHLAPRDFAQIRKFLGHGSGFESPGWQNIQVQSKQLGKSFFEFLERLGSSLHELYTGSPAHPAYQLAEVLVDLDERVNLWRVRHYRIALRIVGLEAVGTKGTPVNQLTHLIQQELFPALWEVRSELTNAKAYSKSQEGSGSVDD